MPNHPSDDLERRKRRLVNKDVQGRLIGIMALLVIAAAFLFFVTELVLGGSAVAGRAFTGLLVVLILALSGVAYIGLRFSQRIAGPIYGFARGLARVVKGDYAQEMRLRRDDQFQNLAAAFNQTLEALRGRVREDMALLEQLEAGMDSLSGDGKDALVAKAREARSAKEQHLTIRPAK